MTTGWPSAEGSCSEVGPPVSGLWSRPLRPSFFRTSRGAQLPKWPGASAQLAQERVLYLVGRNLDPRVHHERAVRPGDDRVEVEFGDLGQIVGEPRDAEQQIAQCCQVS